MLERIDIQKRIIIETLLNSEVIRLIISIELAKKYGFKLKRLIYVRNLDRTFNKMRPVENTVEVNIL